MTIGMTMTVSGSDSVGDTHDVGVRSREERILVASHAGR